MTQIPWRWAAPETIRSNGKTMNTATDVFMLGVAFWEMCCAHHLPFDHIQAPCQLMETYKKGMGVRIYDAALFFIAMVPHYPAIVDRPVPINYILEVLDLRWLQLAFVVMLVGTFIETGSGMIHAINERIAGVMETMGKSLSGRNRALIAIGMLVGALLMSRFGIIDLISKKD